DRDFLKAHYAKSNPFSALPMIQNEGLLMFACTSLGKDCVFYCADFDAVVIAIQSPDELTCMDVFCDAGPSLQEILAGVATEGTRKVILGFTPTDTTDYAFHVRMGEEETLFVLQDKENLFAHHQAMFPLLSHA
ncbi:MAG: GNAT family N-acetyltransferase, partial [Clostridia bacterium]